MTLEQQTAMRILLRTIMGANEITDTDEASGASNFWNFMQEVGLGTEVGLLEIAQVLKVPFEQLRCCDLIGNYAQDNIREYVRNYRISEAGIEFLQAQNGMAGLANKPTRDDGTEFNDNCG